LKLYRRDAITRTEATVFLEGMRFDEPSIETLLNSIELDQLLDDRAGEVKFIVGRAKAGTIDFERAQTELESAGLSEKERARALLTIVRSKERATRLPTKKDLVQWLKAGVITEDRVRAVLAEMGYSREWADLYLQDFRTRDDEGELEELDTEELQTPA
jgi:hypothetical protein